MGVISERKIRQFFEMAERVVSKCKVNEIRFSEHFHLGDDDFYPRDLVMAVTEGDFRGGCYATWMPIAGSMYRDESFRRMLLERAEQTWRVHAMNSLVPLDVLTGPKGKLPQ